MSTFAEILTAPLNPDETERDRLLTAIGMATTELKAGSASLRASSTEILKLRAQLAEAVGLLKPFAEFAQYYTERPDVYRAHPEVRVIDLRRARDFIGRMGK